MKKQFLIGSLLLSNVCAFAQLSEIEGVVSSNNKDKAAGVSLVKVVDGQFEVLATTQLNADGSFAFLVKPSNEGFYAIQTKDQGRQFPIYLKQGDHVQVTIDDKNKVELAGKNTPENQVLASWSKMTEELKARSINAEGYQGNMNDFSKCLAQVADKTETFKKGINTKNATFNGLMKKLTTYDLDIYALYYLASQKEMPSREGLSAYYKQIVVKDKFSNDDIFLMGNGKMLMKIYPYFAGGFDKQPTLDERLQYLTTNRQKAEMVLAEYKGMKTYEQFEDMMAKYGQYLQAPNHKRIVEALDKKLLITKTKFKAPGFTYPDLNGKMVSLSDFTGKVVLMDIWASWCGPCKQEIPYLNALEKEMHGKDVVFLSVSIDKLSDKDKWLKAIADNQAGGNQLFSGNDSQFAKDYMITTIPRFVIIDKKGNMVQMNAPRPSSPDLKQLLLEELKK
ncbi:TlpA family protein disulfide reductase [Solitalea sp. MAHUQ-68]|uniref:TlpA family protein disulfide reductase n=1 Tax=Solitalea agri TaxID=2953739 RepID=A0A9X2JG42_9SPHI|nr:TlpA disulfide reductase family protein [Solitalea agri]MCO4294056.1 TlpA family protein disulfide reductase [Solitalea agri]